MIKNSILDLIGNTPMLKINNLNTYGNNIFLKLEGYNPSRSTKDRIVLEMIEDAEKKGIIKDSTTIIEATSGNTGISLAMICAIKKYPLKIVMPDTMSIERIQLMKAYGAEVILTPGILGMKACLEKLEELDGKILLISLSDKEYEKYDTVKASINALNIMKNIDVNNEKVNPHLLKPNYIKKIEAEAKL